MGRAATTRSHPRVGGEIGYTGWRDRVRTPVTTVPLFLRHILHGHTVCTRLPHRSGWRCRAVACWHAQATLPRRLFTLLLARVGSVVPPCVSSEGRWHGHRP